MEIVLPIAIVAIFLALMPKNQKREQKKKLVYLASPYSHPMDDVRIKNYEMVSKYAACLVADGHVVFSPITYGHHLVEFRQMPTDWEFWKNFCLTFLAKCDEMVVYQMEGWENSRGVAEEIQFCKEHNIPVIYVKVN